METENWPNIICKVRDFYSIKSVNSWEFSVQCWKFYLSFEQNIFKDISQDCFTLRLRNVARTYSTEPNFTVSTCIIDKWGKLNFVQYENVTSYKEYSIWNVRRKDILNVSDDLLCDVISLLVVFGPGSSIFRNSVQESHHTNEKGHRMIQADFELAASCMKSLSEDLFNLLKNKDNTDMILKCGDKTFPVHKIILSARSDVFAAMFRSNMSEKRDGVVEIRDTDPVILKEFLQYIYTGTLSDITEDTAPLLYATAHKYAVDALQARCGNFMEENLSEANACNHLILADAHDDSNLKNRIISFIRYNEEILSGEEWIKLCDGNPKLTIEVYRKLYKDISPVIP